MIEPITYAEDTQPDLVGVLGRAWKTDIAAIARRQSGGPPPELTVAGWIVEARYAHPIWHSYLICAISLRKMPNWRAPRIYLAGATHEVMVFALDPDQPRALNSFQRLLMPANFCGQWIGGDDAAAAAYIHETVQFVIDGRLSPDTDYIRHWMHRFSASNVKDPARAGETKIIVGVGSDEPATIVIPAKPRPQDMN